MKHERRSNLILFCVLVFLCLPAAFGGERWSEVRTENFRIVGDPGEKKLLKVGQRLEEFRHALRQVAPHLSKETTLETTVVVFADDRDFHPYKPFNAGGRITSWVAGYFQAGTDRNYIALALGGRADRAYRTIFHEYVHYLIDNGSGRPDLPAFYSEGLAEYYDSMSVEKDVVRLGGADPVHLRILGQNGLIPLKEFFATDYDRLRSSSKEDANRFYAQSWALASLFMNETGAPFDLSGFGRYVEKLQRGSDAEAAFREVFGTGFSELENRLLLLIDKKIFPTNVTSLNGVAPAYGKYSTRPLGEAEMLAGLGDLLYQQERFEDAAPLLERALKLDPGSARALSTLGLIRFKQNRNEEARGLLQRSVAASDAGYLEFYRYAHFLSRAAIDFGSYVSDYADETASEMRAALRRSIDLNPRFPENYKLLGFIALVRNEDLSEGISNLRTALALAPGNLNYRLILAQLHLRNRELEEAFETASPIALGPAEPILRRRAEQVLSHISELRRRSALALMNEPSERPRADETEKLPRPLTEEELERNRRQTEIERIVEVMRRPRPDERRILGRIEAVECSPGRILFKVRDGGTQTLLSSPDFRGLLVWTYTGVMRGVTLECDADLSASAAVLTYRPVSGEEDHSGRLVSIEFVPSDLVLKKVD